MSFLSTQTTWPPSADDVDEVSCDLPSRIVWTEGPGQGHVVWTETFRAGTVVPGVALCCFLAALMDNIMNHLFGLWCYI